MKVKSEILSLLNVIGKLSFLMMIRHIVILIFFGICYCSQSSEDQKDASAPIVSTPLGKYQGSILTSSLGKTIYSFRGIRYAEPPVKDLRFKPPVPIKKHDGIYNAREDGAVCPQPIEGTPVSEDCLFVNVYSTKLPERSDNPKRPVIIYIHPGGFYGLTGRSSLAGPQYFLNQDIVLVTFNYRLGALGFLSTGDKEAPGNNGLKDQVELMKWVKKNIEAFGGDPNSITLFGYSAGATSVTLHLLSPMSEGLFHKGIIGSSSGLNQWPTSRNQLDVTKRQARVVGCSDDSSSNIVQCLRGKSAEELGNSLRKMFEFGNEPVLLWKPVIEGEFGQERFLTDHPIKLVLEGKFQKIPILAGITAEEFANRALEIITKPEMLSQLDKNWEKLAPITFLYERDTDRSKSISRGLRSFYFGNQTLGKSVQVQMTNLYNEAQSGFAVNRAVKLLASKNSQPVYYYRFSYKGRFSHYYLPESNGTVPYGPVHHDDLIYMFCSDPLFPKIEKTDPEFRTVQKLTTMWANFARTGKPIPETCGRLDYAEWDPYNTKTQKYMDIGDTLKMGEKLYEDRYAEWEKLFPLSQYNKIEDVSY
ncbi:hypothetical protein HHI36_014864 [Cryptolaemus montrouzieri]|uniref:Carboxylic ester hydrolase n=1 Tax=Cryptolaemus montrouzieri TaxID=559131 RepID=A0ABD2N3V7_9CUCU